MQIVTTVRALIPHEGKLLMCRLPVHHFYCLPGGKLEPGETIEAGMERELIEETGIKPAVGKLLFINQYISDQTHRVEFFFHITNGADYAQFDPTAATHSHEIADFALADPADPKYDLRPDFLKSKFADIARLGEAYPLEIIHSA